MATTIINQLKLKSMEFNIKRNDYVRPRDVRRDVVQKICDCILSRVNDDSEEDDYEIRIEGRHPAIIISEKINDPSISDLFVRDSRHSLKTNGRSNYTTVRTCEMKMVFKVLQDAGYYIRFYEGSFTYFVSKRPYFGRIKAERIEFDFFID